MILINCINNSLDINELFEILIYKNNKLIIHEETNKTFCFNYNRGIYVVKVCYKENMITKVVHNDNEILNFYFGFKYIYKSILQNKKIYLLDKYYGLKIERGTIWLNNIQ